jgi:hypothetical protein
VNAEIIGQPAIRDFVTRMGECTARAHARVRLSLQDQNWAESKKRSRASLMNDFCIGEARREFADDEETSFLDENQLTSIVTGFAQVRVKKSNRAFSKLPLNQNRRTRNWTQLPLSEELSPLDKLWVAYSLSPNWQNLLEFALVEFDRNTLVDALIFPFEDDPDFTNLDTPFPMQVPLRLNLEGMRRIEQVALMEGLVSASRGN